MTTRKVISGWYPSFKSTLKIKSLKIWVDLGHLPRTRKGKLSESSGKRAGSLIRVLFAPNFLQPDVCKSFLYYCRKIGFTKTRI